MYYLADTVALVRHLRGGRGLGRQARRILREADQGQHTIAISGITEVLQSTSGFMLGQDSLHLGN
jgi:hypothetical protein